MLAATAGKLHSGYIQADSDILLHLLLRLLLLLLRLLLLLLLLLRLHLLLLLHAFTSIYSTCLLLFLLTQVFEEQEVMHSLRNQDTYCPHKDCSKLLVLPDEELLLPDEPIECSECHRGFCLRKIPGFHRVGAWLGWGWGMHACAHVCGGLGGGGAGGRAGGRAAVSVRVCAHAW